MTSASASTSLLSSTQEYLAFRLNEEEGAQEYAVDIRLVQELRGYESLGIIENAPFFVRGAWKSRGREVVVLDLRTMLDCGEIDLRGAFTVIVPLGHGEHIVSVVVESVSDVVESDSILPIAQIKAPVPEFKEFSMLGYIRYKSRNIIILDAMPLFKYAR